MQNKVILISIDGMRPDGLKACGNQYLTELEAKCAYTYSGASLFPPITFPCHFSMSRSVTPQRHGILTNTYVPEVRPVKGIFEKIREAGGMSAMFYGWDNMRDIATPGSLKIASYMNFRVTGESDTYLTDECLRTVENYSPDFVFLYLPDTDDLGGHAAGWMSEEYLHRISIAIDNVKRVFEKFSNKYRIIIMSDHGGHERTHGVNCSEDMTIPFFFYGEEFTPGQMSEPISLLEIAPTIAKIMGIPQDEDWEGHPVF